MLNESERHEAADEIERLREATPERYYEIEAWGNQQAAEIERLTAENAMLRAALTRLLNDSMYKDHPEASQMAIDAINIHKHGET